MNGKRIIFAAVVIWIVNWFLATLSCGYLFNWVYQLPPIIWKKPAEFMTPTVFFYIQTIALIKALFFVFVFALLYKGIPGKGMKKGFLFGILVWLIGALPGLAPLPFYMTISTTVIIYWIIIALVLNCINGLFVGGIYKEKARK